MKKNELKKDIVRQVKDSTGLNLDKADFAGNILNMLGVSARSSFTQALLLNSGFSRKRGQFFRETHVNGDPESLNYVVTTDHRENPVILRLRGQIDTKSGYAVYFFTSNLYYHEDDEFDHGYLYVLDYETGRLFFIK